MLLTDSNIDIAKLVSQIKRHEGFSKTPYADTEGYTTIGYGRNLDTVGLRHDEAQLMLENDIAKAIEYLEQYPWWPELDGSRQRAMADMMFNLGPGGFATFKRMIACLHRCDYEGARKEMIDSKWFKQVGRRAKYNADLMKGDAQ